MIGRDIEDDRYLGMKRTNFGQLKAGKLGDIEVIIPAFFSESDQRRSDVSCQVTGQAAV